MEAIKKQEASKPISHAAKRIAVIFSIFMLLHQTDKLLIGPLQNPIMETFNMTYTQWGLINTGALVVGSLLYPIWGWLNDKYNRGKLLALASFIWGSTTWISAIAPNFKFFLVTRSSTGIDDSSYPGMYSMISDLYSPKVRGKIYGLLQLTQPIGYLLGMVLALVLAGIIGWRYVFYITGSLGVVLAIFIFFSVKDVPRGSSEDELQGIETSQYKFSWKALGSIFKRKSLIMVYLQGFFGVFPWNVITFYIFGYMGKERGYSDSTTLLIMAPAILLMAAGYPVGGWLGDKLFKRTKRGRLIVSIIGAAGSLIGLWLFMHTASSQVLLFAVLLCATAFVMPFASPNIVSTMYDVTVPEVRSSANAIESFLESFGAASAPLIAGAVADATSVGNSIIWICSSAWALCIVFLLGAIYFIPKDIDTLHKELEARAVEAKAKN
ncbi:MAG: MFS transporter [Chloroflexota bacterium]|nr:MFS transporter [Chloroflexota bacterium]